MLVDNPLNLYGRTLHCFEYQLCNLYGRVLQSAISSNKTKSDLLYFVGCEFLDQKRVFST